MSNPYAPPQASDDNTTERIEPDHPVADPPKASPPIPQGEEFVSVYTANDVLEADMLSSMLEAEGIATPGFSRTTGADVGLGWMAGEHVIRVPRSQKERARELIAAFHEGSDDALPPEAGAPEPILERSRPASHRAVGILFLLLLFPGVIAAVIWTITSFLR